MSDELMIPQVEGQPLVKFDDSDFESVSKVGDYLPRLQVCGGSSEVVKAGKIDIGTMALVKDKDNPTPLGKSVDVVILSWRPKAMDMSTGTPISYFNRSTDGFKTTQAKADIKDSNCMFGPEFLVYVPSKNTFATFYMGSKTARKQSPNMLALMKAAAKEKGMDSGYAPAKATIGTVFIQATINNKKQSWHGPSVNPCTAPLTVEIDPTEFADELNKFNNPKDSEVEVVAASGDGDRAR